MEVYASKAVALAGIKLVIRVHDTNTQPSHGRSVMLGQYFTKPRHHLLFKYVAGSLGNTLNADFLKGSLCSVGGNQSININFIYE